jgi:two-component system, OmpR family, alkaline phosphatase synthesis response regulator PhoP
MARVLYVEDEDDLRQNFARELRQAGVEILEERLAEGALRSVDRWVPDLVLLDIGMPPGEMSGMELLIALRQNERWRHLPVIVLSGLGSQINLDIMARLGVRTVLTKGEVTARDVARRIEEAVTS